jgi:hypothetical protein
MKAGPIISLCLGDYSTSTEFSGWVNGAVETLIMSNRTWLARNPVPPLYKTKVIYQREPPEWNSEHFDAIPVVLQRGWGDCDDLVSWRIAEIRNYLDPSLRTINLNKYDARFPRNFPTALISFKRHVESNKYLYHVRVRHQPSGALEDPSALLGMKAPLHSAPMPQIEKFYGR